jgi:hypothetical protein
VLFGPTPLQALLTISAVGYFVWWGCISTAAPTLRPPTPLPEGQHHQVGGSVNSSAAIVNAGVGGTLWGRHLLTERLELGWFAEYGAIVTPFSFSEPSPYGDAVLGGGVSGRWYFFPDGPVRLGVEVYATGAHTLVLRRAPYGYGTPTTLAQTYISLPVSISATDEFSLYTNPAVGGLLVVQWYGNQPQSLIPVPSVRLPIGAELRLNDWSSLIAEVGVAGILLVGTGPYGSLSMAVSF